MKCAEAKMPAIREWKSTLQLIRLEKHREAQFHIYVLYISYEGWHDSTRQIFTRRQELLSKYAADVAGESRTVVLLE